MVVASASGHDADEFGAEDLSWLGGGFEAGCFDDGGAEAVAVLPGDITDREPDADLYGTDGVGCVAVGVDGLLHLDGRGER